MERIIKEPGRFGSWQPSGDHSNNSNCQDTEKSPGDVGRLAFT